MNPEHRQSVSAERLAERHRIETEFREWHLNTWFVPFNPNTVIHVARLEGFLAGYRTGKGIDVGTSFDERA